METDPTFARLKNVLLALLIGGFTILNLYLAQMTWAQIADSLGWITVIKQNADIKIRHFVQFSPQVVVLALILVHCFRLTHYRALLISILFSGFNGITSEVVQFFSKTRIFSFYDILWNSYAVLYGGVVYSLGREFIRNRIRDWNVAFRSLQLFFFYFTTTFLFFQSLFFSPFNGDDFKILSAVHSPDSSDFQYWLSILTEPTNAGVQYRPLSYFMSGILLNRFFDLTPMSTSIAAVFLISTTAFLFFCLFVHLYGKVRWATVLPLFFLLGPWFVKAVVTFRDLFKYSFTLAILLGSLLWVVKRDLNLKRSILIALLIAVCILSHEGAIVFPFVISFFAFQRSSVRDSIPQIFILFIPTAIYLFMRFAYWGIPLQGFMALSFYTIDDVYFHHFSTLFSFYFVSNYWLGAFVANWILYSLVVASSEVRNRIGLYLASLVVLILPFSMLNEHISKSHVSWFVPFILLILYEIFNSRSSPKRWGLLRATILFLVGSSIIASSVLEKKRYLKNADTIKESRDLAKAIVDSLPQSEDAFVSLKIDDQFEIDGYELGMTAAALSFAFPDRKFVVRSQRLGRQAVVDQGRVLVYELSQLRQGEVVAKDPFNREIKLSPPELSGEAISIPPLSGNIFEKYHVDGDDVPAYRFDFRFTDPNLPTLK